MLRLRDVRKENSMTQNKVAELLNVTTATYNRYEKGVIRPDPETLKKLSAIFNVSVDYLLGLPVDLASKVPPQYTDMNTSYLDKALGLGPKAAHLSGRILSSKDNKKIELTLDVLERIMTMNDEQLEALAVFLRTIK